MIGVIERIEAGLACDTPSRVKWRTLLETALTEIKEIRHHHDEFVVSATIRMTDQNTEIATLRAALVKIAQGGNAVYSDLPFAPVLKRHEMAELAHAALTTSQRAEK